MSIDDFPAGFRAVKRWRIALRIWASTTLFMGTVFTVAVIVLLHLMWPDRPYSFWRLTFAIFAVVAFANVPMGLKIVKSYPAPFRWKK